MTELRRLHLCAALACPVALGCSSPLERNWEAYRQAKKAGDYETAATYLHEDARIWFGEKKGAGAPLRPRGGPYKEWDKEFRSTSKKEDIRVVGRTLTYIAIENNDFYRLIERTPSKAHVTYYFDEDDRITGMLYAGLATAADRPPDRFEEFKAWANDKYPGTLDSEEMKIPNNPKRWRALLTEWRAETGLPAIE